MRIDTACERTATELRIERGAEILVCDRVMSADGHPVQLAISRLHRTFTKGTAIEQDNPGPGGIYARLEEGGRRLARFEERVSARLATMEETSTFQLSTGTPVLTITRIAFTTGDVPVEINDMVLIADRYELIYDLPAD